MVHIIPKSGFARTYLIEEDENIMAVDVGSIGAAQEIEAYCSDVLQKSTQGIRFIISTHFHIDHIGGIGTLLRKCSLETLVLFHPFVQEYLAGSRELPPMENWVNGLVPTALASLSNIKKPSDCTPETLSGIPPSALRPPMRVAQHAQGSGQRLEAIKNHDHLPYESHIRYFDAGRLPRYQIGFGDWEVIVTPGHTEDSVSLYSNTTKELICGDLIIGDFDGTGFLNNFCQDEKQIQETFQMLKENIRPVVIYPGHGGIIKDAENAFRKVRCAEPIDKLRTGFIEGRCPEPVEGRTFPI